MYGFPINGSVTDSSVVCVHGIHEIILSVILCAPNSWHLPVFGIFGKGMPDTELTNDSKVAIGITVSIILTVFCAVAIFMLYRKYNSINAKENKDNYGLENFYISRVFYEFT